MRTFKTLSQCLERIFQTITVQFKTIPLRTLETIPDFKILTLSITVKVIVDTIIVAIGIIDYDCADNGLSTLIVGRVTCRL